MSDLFEDPPAPGDNTAEFTVSEISGAVKRAVESGFSRVRVRGEIGRISRPRSGHIYLDLKDDRSVLAGVVWKGQAARLAMRPEEGLEVVATGRLTTFPGQSKYQMVIEDMAPAGVGALMAMLEKRRKALEAEGLFAGERKRPLPYLPEVIGVVTSPSGAVIRDILHRLRDRFPRKVLIWPVAVQGDRCAPEVTRGINGFNALTPGGALPRPDVIIVARGGGSVEDLWGFNEEIVVRAAAASDIPLISAVGHETDTTLIDHAADRRAPTPTAAAEMAVPVRLDLLRTVEAQGDRLTRASIQLVATKRQRVRDLSRALPQPETLADSARQRLDYASDRLPRALQARVQLGHRSLANASAGLSITLLSSRLGRMADRVGGAMQRLTLGLWANVQKDTARLNQAKARLTPRTLQRTAADTRARLASTMTRGQRAANAQVATQRHALSATSQRLTVRPLERTVSQNRADLRALVTRLERATASVVQQRTDRLAALERVRQSFNHHAVLKRGFAVVRDGTGQVLTTQVAAKGASELELEFQDGRMALGGPVKPTKAAKSKGQNTGGQGSLFDE
ncbi:MAG: exodeoxyribonuclease VII large subunit [Pseudomonadota bacterium]